MAVMGRPVAMNLLGVVEHPAFESASPYLVDRDGHPFLPTGDAGVVLGVRLGDRIDATAGEQVVPGLTLVHPDPAARASLTALSCVGNTLTVRTGAAAGARGSVVGKRGEAGRVIGSFEQAILARMRPGDQVSVRAVGQGWAPDGLDAAVVALNTAPGMLARLGVAVAPDGGVDAPVAAVFPARTAGNGIGRPAHQWDIELQVVGRPAGLRLGDLVTVDDLDVRHNVGFRRGWRTVGVIVSGASRLPGHGPGLTALLTGPRELVRVVEAGPADGRSMDPALTAEVLAAHRDHPADTVTT